MLNDTPSLASTSAYARRLATPVVALVVSALLLALTAVASRAATAPLVFGIYPGGAAGTVATAAAPLPDNPTLALAALEQLRAPGVPFVVRLYAGYTGVGSWTSQQQVGAQVAQYSAAGFDIELALTYRPADGGSPADVAGFDAFVRQTIDEFAPDPRFVSLQVTDEANASGAPNASDGFYSGAEDALITGVIAAGQEIKLTGDAQLQVGFSWAYAGNTDEAAFWRYLASNGGPAFVSALDWVGLDVYPDTWGASPQGNITESTTSTINAALSVLRETDMPLAGIPDRVALHLAEIGYPTSPTRTASMQAQVMRAAVGTVEADSAKYNITNFNWFDLRDANSSSPSFEDQYGLMTDRYTPKAAFWEYKSLIAAGAKLTVSAASRGRAGSSGGRRGSSSRRGSSLRPGHRRNVRRRHRDQGRRLRRRRVRLNGDQLLASILTVQHRRGPQDLLVSRLLLGPALHALKHAIFFADARAAPRRGQHRVAAGTRGRQARPSTHGLTAFA